MATRSWGRLLGILTMAAMTASARGQASLMPEFPVAPPVIEITELSQELALEGLPISGHAAAIAELHRRYLEGVAKLRAETAPEATRLGLSGLTGETAAAVEAGIKLRRRVLDEVTRLDDVLFAALVSEYSESAQGALADARERRRLALTMSAGARGYDYFDLEDIDAIVSRLNLAPQERRAALDALAPSRGERRAAFEALNNAWIQGRVAAARLIEEDGAVGLTREEIERRQRERDARPRAPRPDGTWERPLLQRVWEVSRQPPSMVARAVELEMRALAEVEPHLSAGSAAILRNRFWERVGFANPFLTRDYGWEGRESRLSPRWVGRRLLSQPSLTGAKRQQIRELLEGWSRAIVEARVRETTDALKLIKESGEDRQAIDLIAGKNNFVGGHLDLEDAARRDEWLPKIAAAAEAPWLLKTPMEAPPDPPVSEFPVMSAAELAIVGTPPLASPAPGTRQCYRDPIGVRSIDADFEALIISSLKLEGAAAQESHRLIEADRAARAGCGKAPAQTIYQGLERPPGNPTDRAAARAPLFATAAEKDAAYQALAECARSLDATLWQGVEALQGVAEERESLEHLKAVRAMDAPLGVANRVDEDYAGSWVNIPTLIDAAHLKGESRHAALGALAPLLPRLADFLEEDRRQVIARERQRLREEIDVLIPTENDYNLWVAAQQTRDRADGAFHSAHLRHMAQWRQLEAEAMTAMMKVLPEPQAKRLRWELLAARYPALYGTGVRLRAAADELLGAIEADPGVDPQASAVELISRQVGDFLDRDEMLDRATSLLEQRSIAETFETGDAFQKASSDRRRPVIELSLQNRTLAANTCWLLIQLLPPELVDRSPTLKRFAYDRGIPLRPMP